MSFVALILSLAPVWIPLWVIAATLLAMDKKLTEWIKADYCPCDEEEPTP